MRVQPDGPLDDWSLEQKGPIDMKADFILAVTEPRALRANFGLSL
jgi:hypothetical protein